MNEYPGRTARFAADEAGAVTVDWVVLTAALVGLGLAVMGATSKGVQDASEDIDAQLTSDMSVTFLSFQSRGLASMTIADGYCTMTEDGTGTCTPGYSVMEESFAMSDGTSWSRVTDSREKEAYWTDADGARVEADDVPTLPDDLPYAF